MRFCNSKRWIMKWNAQRNMLLIEYTNTFHRFSPLSPLLSAIRFFFFRFVYLIRFAIFSHVVIYNVLLIQICCLRSECAQQTFETCRNNLYRTNLYESRCNKLHLFHSMLSCFVCSCKRIYLWFVSACCRLPIGSNGLHRTLLFICHYDDLAHLHKNMQQTNDLD